VDPARAAAGAGRKSGGQALALALLRQAGRRVLPLFVEWGIDALNPIQPSCNNIYSIQKQYGRELCLVGNMCIEGLAGGGYVVASSHSIIDSIPLENYYAMTETAREYGVFRRANSSAHVRNR